MNNKFIKFFINNWLTILLAFLPPIIIIYYFQREVRQLDVKLLSNTPVVQIDKDYSDSISVFYINNPIKALNVLEIVVKNGGNKPIVNEDFKKPLTFIFDTNVLPNVKITGIEPGSLEPTITSIAPNILVLEPLLLNPNDYFSFLVYLVDADTHNTPLKISARIIGIREPQLRIEADFPARKDAWLKYLEIIGIVLASITSLISLGFLGKRFKEIAISISSFGNVGIKLNQDESGPTIAGLAQKFNIVGQDYKANLLLLRIKIEEQLLEIASKIDIPPSQRIKSANVLTRKLADRGVLTGNIPGIILNILPLINRELHASDSYLSSEEFESLQRISIRMIAELMKINEQSSDRRDESNADNH